MGRPEFRILVFVLIALAPLSGSGAGEEVRTGFERTVGAALAIGALDLPITTRCPDEGWSAAPPERPPAHPAAPPFVLRIEPRICLDGQRLEPLPPSTR
jgi:hypothetical protein